MKSRLSLLLAVCLIGVACGGEGADTTTTVDGDESTSSGGETTTTAAETTTTAAEATTTTAAAASGGDDCLVGSWVLDDQAFFDQVFAEMDEETTGFGEVTSVSGSFVTTLNANGSMEAVRDDWGFSVATDDGTFNIVINGTQTGTWETDGSTLLLTLDEGGAMDVEASVVVDGEEVVLPSAPMEVPSEALASSSEFSCSGDELSVTSEGVTSEFDRA
ncbi:MAG: hypothetical protein WDZ96_05100 [Acidimicrobiia bacterium]